MTSRMNRLGSRAAYTSAAFRAENCCLGRRRAGVYLADGSAACTGTNIYMAEKAFTKHLQTPRPLKFVKT